MRRHLIGAFLASGLVAALTGAGAAADKIGFIYVGPAADYGYNMSMDLGRQYVEKELGASRPPPSRRSPRRPRSSG